MPARTFPNIGLLGGYDPHEGGWGDDQNANLLKLSALVQGTVISKLSATPGSPTPPAVYLFDETHPTNPNVVAIFEGPVGEEDWTYIDPEAGWLVYNQQEEYYEKFDGTVWAELETGGGGGGGIEEAPEDGTPYVRKDGAWASLPDVDGAYAYRVGFFFIATPDTSEVLALHIFTDDVDFADDFAGAVGKVDTNPTATFTMNVAKNGSNIGTISVSTSGVVTFATTGGAESFAAGDIMRITAPAVADTTVQGGAFTFKGSYA